MYLGRVSAYLACVRPSPTSVTSGATVRRFLVKLAPLAVVAALLAVVGLAPSADAARTPQRACKTMKSTSCVYDARHMGDGHGRSFWVGKNGKRHFIAHAQAHGIVYGKKARPTQLTPPAPPVPPVPAPEAPAPLPPAPEPSAIQPPPKPAYPTGYAAIGDSITFGQGSSDPATKSWPALLGLPYVGRPGRALTVWNWTGPPLLNTFTSELADLGSPHTVVVEIGTNDVGATDANTVIAGYEALLKQAEAAGTRVVLTTIPPRAPAIGVHDMPIAPKIAAVNEWIRTQDHIDLDPCVGDGQVEPQLLPAYDSGDGIHPSDAGYAQIASCVLAYLN
jgi:lysophospholipase L1-like esterase